MMSVSLIGASSPTTHQQVLCGMLTLLLGICTRMMLLQASIDFQEFVVAVEWPMLNIVRVERELAAQFCC